MEATRLKQYLLEIADKVQDDTELEDIYQQLSLLNDIDISEQQVINGETVPQSEVIKQSERWLK